jgi:hypothetical protein
VESRETPRLSQQQACELLSVTMGRLEQMRQDGLLPSLALEDVLRTREQQWIPASEVAAILGVNRARVGQLVDAGRLPPPFQAIPGGKRWFRKRQVEVIANARESRRLRGTLG